MEKLIYIILTPSKIAGKVAMTHCYFGVEFLEKVRV